MSFHCDGPLREEALSSLRKVLKEAMGEGVVEEDARWTVLEVKSRAVPRLLGKRGLQLFSPEKGAYVQLDSFQILVATTGFPEQPPLPMQAPARPILIELADANYWELPLTELARDVYWLSELHWSSGLRSPRLPITTLYVKRLKAFWRAGVVPPEELYRRLWFL